MSLLAELRQRKVVRVAAVYAVVGWLLLQVASLVLPALNLPAWTVTFTTILVILGFPLALVLAWSFDVVRDRGAKPVAGGARSVLVLPFANLSDDSALGHFADGLVEDLLTRLQANPELKVASRQSSYAYKGRNVDVRTIARDLGCRFVVEGSVRRIDDRVRVTAQLIDGVEDQHLWAERYDHTLTDVFALQDEIRDAVIAAISQRLVGDREVAGTPEDLASPRLEPGVAASAESQSRPFRHSGRWWTALAVIAAVVLAGLLTWTLQTRDRERWAREEALPKIEALITEEKFGAALDLVQQAARVIPNDPQLRALEQQCSAPASVDTDPSGAEAYYRPYDGADEDWKLLGRTPLVDVPVPLGVGLWRFEHPGRETTLRVIGHPGAELGSHRDAVMRDYFQDVGRTIPLPEAGSLPPGMVLVPSTNRPIAQFGDRPVVDLPAYYIDRFEVTNREFKEFVAAGGYREAAYWQDLPFGDSVPDWQVVVARFVDTTGRPGPSTWELGAYPDGEADHPVSGVSWFEAMAYARFRGKELPTASHWYRAAMSMNLHVDTVAPSVARRGNFGGRATRPVGSTDAAGPYGTYDMAGNVREWLWTAIGGDRMLAGGAWNEPPYAYQNLSSADPWDRSPGNGLRTIRNVSGSPTVAALRQPFASEALELDSLRPVDDAGYAVLESQLRYTPWTPDARAAAMASRNPAWTHERVTLPTGYDSGTFDVQLFLPAGRTPPYQLVVLLPHSGYIGGNQPSAEFDPATTNLPLDFLMKSGRGLVVIAFDGMFERSWPPERHRSMSMMDRYRQLIRHYRQEIGRTLDYLATRDDVDGTSFGVLGFSYGANQMVPLLALEPRLGPAVLVGGGVRPMAEPPTADEPFNFLPRVTQPILMLSGRSDMVFSQESHETMLRLLGTPDDRKQRVLFDAGHGWLPHKEFVRLTLDWFDRHLGPTS